MGPLALIRIKVKLVDVAMVPWSDGRARGSQQSATVSIPPHLVMVTAYGREDVLKQAEENGLENVLVKPVTSSTLFDTVVAVLRAPREATDH